MTDKLFQTGISKDNRERIIALAKEVFKKEEKDLTKKDIMFLVHSDMATRFNKMTVSASATRPTEVKYATNNYFISTEIDLSGIKETMEEHLKDTPEDQLIDRYLELKSVTLSLMTVKYQGTENYLRSLLDDVMAKDNIQIVGRNKV